MMMMMTNQEALSCREHAARVSNIFKNFFVYNINDKIWFVNYKCVNIKMMPSAFKVFHFYGMACMYVQEDTSPFC